MLSDREYKMYKNRERKKTSNMDFGLLGLGINPMTSIFSGKEDKDSKEKSEENS